MLHVFIYNKEKEKLNQYSRKNNIVGFSTCICTSVGLYLVVLDLHELYRSVTHLPHLCNTNVKEIVATEQSKNKQFLYVTSNIYLVLLTIFF